MQASRETPLLGRRILLIEDEFIFAAELKAFLTECGAQVLGPFGKLSPALNEIATGKRIDAAVLNVNLGGQKAWLALDELQKAGIPVLLVSGYSPEHLPERCRELLYLEKPVKSEDVCQALSRLINLE